MKWLFFYIINLVSVSASLASTCDVLKVTSQDPINKTQFFGNGFAYTNKLIITNDPVSYTHLRAHETHPYLV
ncbi:MAG: hypothetical protein ACK5W9_06705, partial [Bdellovibrionales bacterium]